MQGGMETFSQTLAQQLTLLGHTVNLITDTFYEDEDVFAFHVLRKPSFFKLLKDVAKSDVVICNGISLKFLLPVLCWKNKTIVIHHNWYSGKGLQSILSVFKRSLCHLYTNISVSQAIAARLSVSSEVVPNPYDATLFRLISTAKRNKDLVFLGRLVSDKGVDILLDSLKLLKDKNILPSCTIIGSGPELQNLKKLVKRYVLQEQVTFVDKKSGKALVDLLNQHKIMVVPSRWDEPFGIVALEGMACGCVIVGSSGGGLPEAIGPCGTTFPNNDAQALFTQLERLLKQPEELNKYQNAFDLHLRKHHPEIVVQAYLNIAERIARPRKNKLHE